MSRLVFASEEFCICERLARALPDSGSDERRCKCLRKPESFLLKSTSPPLFTLPLFPLPLPRPRGSSGSTEQGTDPKTSARAPTPQTRGRQPSGGHQPDELPRREVSAPIPEMVFQARYTRRIRRNPGVLRFNLLSSRVISDFMFLLPYLSLDGGYHGVALAIFSDITSLGLRQE